MEKIVAKLSSSLYFFLSFLCGVWLEKQKFNASSLFRVFTETLNFQRQTAPASNFFKKEAHT